MQFNETQICCCVVHNLINNNTKFSLVKGAQKHISSNDRDKKYGAEMYFVEWSLLKWLEGGPTVSNDPYQNQNIMVLDICRFSYVLLTVRRTYPFKIFLAASFFPFGSPPPPLQNGSTFFGPQMSLT